MGLLSGARRSLAIVISAAMAAAVIGTISGAPPADAAPAWGPVSRLAAGRAPGLATNRSGLMVAVWVVRSRQIRASFRAPGGSWQPPVTVATSHNGYTLGTINAGGLPVVVLDDAGTATVMWAEFLPGVLGTAIHSVSGSMSGWSRPEQRQGPVAGPLENYGDARGPVIAVGRDGTVYATWRLEGCAEYTPPNPRDNFCIRIVDADFFATRSPSGTWTTTEKLDAGVGAGDIAVGQDGTVVIAGLRRATPVDRNRWHATVATRGPGGSWSPVRVIDRPGHSLPFGWQVHLAADDTDVTAVFGECDARTRCEVTASRGPAFTTTSAISAAVDSSRVTLQDDPVRLASSFAGELTAVWSLDAGQGERSDGVIQSSRRVPGSDAWGAVRTLASRPHDGETGLAGVAVDDNGTAIASWNHSRQTKTGYSQKAQVAVRRAAGTWGAPAELRERGDAALGRYRVGPVSTRAGSGYTVLAERVGSGIGWSDRIDDTIAPTTRLLGPGASTTTTVRFPVAWTATDGESSVAQTEVQRRTATWRGTVGPWSTWTSRREGGRATFPGSPGRSYCLRARSSDAAGNIGPWSAPQCRTTPVDDRSTRASQGWKRVRTSGTYRGTETVTVGHGRRLSLAGARGRQFALVATTCRSCGSVRVSIGGRAVRTVSLRSPRTVRRHVLPFASYGSLHTGRIVVTVLSHGRPVRVDGIAVVH